MTVSCPAGHDGIETGTFVKDGRDAHVERGGGHRCEAHWRDTPWRPGRHYCYARVELQSGTLVFPSPVLVDYP